MHTLTIITDDEDEIVKVRIKETAPGPTLIAILQTIENLGEPKPPRKTRSDAGKPKKVVTSPGDGADSKE